MAKQKNNSDHEEVTFEGKAIDPELQKKVEDYMELTEAEESFDDSENKTEDAESNDGDLSVNEEATKEEPEVKKVEKDTESESGLATAPLLPSDQLPEDLAKASEEPKSNPKKSISVKFHEDEPEDEPEVPESERVDDSVEKPEAVQPEDPLSPSEEPETQDAQEESQETESPEDPEETAVNEEAKEESSKTEVADDIDETEQNPDNDKSTLIQVDDLDDKEQKIDVAKEPEEKPVVGPAGALWEKYKDKTIDDVEQESFSPKSEDPVTEQAIREIVAEESDKLLEIEDAKNKTSLPTAKKDFSPNTKSKKKRKKKPISKKLVFNLVFLTIFVGALVALFVQQSRHYIFNTVGVRASTSITVLDSKTTLPLKNVEVSVDNISGKTDIEGNVTLDGIRLGKKEMTITKPAYSEIRRDIVFNWGNNLLGDFEIDPVGTRYSFEVVDYVSDKPITKGELIFEESSASFNKNGLGVITVPNIGEQEIEIEVKAENYRSEFIKVSPIKKQDKYRVQLVPSKKHVFFSNRSGKVDLYKSDIDGKNEEVILEGSGIESEDSLGLAVHPSKNIASFTSSRENIRNSEGTLLNTLQYIDLDTKEVVKIAQSERLQIIDWIGERLIYVKVAEGSDKDDTQRHRLISYNVDTNTEDELASTNYFNDILSANGSVYYSPAAYKVNGEVGLYKIDADGSNRKTVFQREVWNLFRTDYEKVSLSVSQDWYELDLGNDSLKKIGGAPSKLKSRLYTPSPDNKRSLWVDERDGKNVLLAYNHDKQKDEEVLAMSGIKSPIVWLDNEHIVFRVETGQETADYVVGLAGAGLKKIVDVVDSFGIDRWYYF